MECNRDEALRAKEIAERKFLSKDLNGAKKFTLKAQTLFPALEGISQMLATLDVHLAAEIRVSGEKDWYAILSVNPLSDDETLKKQYRRLALLLHPDKNKSIGAETAFQFVSEAWNILSDRTKRAIYNQTRNIRTARTPQPYSNPPAPAPAPTPGPNGFSNYARNAEARARGQQQPVRPAPHTAAPRPKPPKPSTFWTSCTKCKMQYEYLRAYVNHNLLCPNCKDPFMAVETPQPGRSTDFSRANVNFQWGPFSRTAGAASAGASSAAAAQAANVVHQAYEKVKREREEAQEKLRKEREEREREKLRREKAKRSHASSFNNGSGFEIPGKRMRGEEKDGINGFSFPSSQGIPFPGSGLGTGTSTGMNSDVVSLRRAFYKLDIRANLMEKGKLYIIKNKKKLQAVLTESDKNPKTDKTDKLEKSENGEDPEGQIMDVPDPEFHDFDGDRTEAAFKSDQIWATYDDEDGMPRYYAFVQKVVSKSPFKVKLTFLSSKSNTEFAPLNWVSDGFAKTSGEFRFTKYETKNSINMFSHLVKWEKGNKGVIRIFPQKGEIWALYKNWDSNWDKNTADEIIYKYDMAVVKEDYNEEIGIAVAPLVKVNRFKAVFKEDPKRVIRVKREEMFRFSHQVPAYRLTGEEKCKSGTGTGSCGGGELKGCFELDPAATPLELLQVIN